MPERSPEPELGTGRAERGSVLMLVPAAVLVLVVLGAIAVDFSVAFLGQRELTGSAAAAANDAATAIAERRFYQGGGGDKAGTVTLDENRAARVVNEALTARAPRGVVIDDVDVNPSGGQVCVLLRGRVDYVFARAIPGMADGASVQGRASATAVMGPPGSPVVPRPRC
ncbi:MAG: hypothetical protein M3404_05670 [Actinomycetota bacterium]|nr:hypothetical protein [Actinomycetota bacterium]